jgi:hypothetical protein
MIVWARIVPKRGDPKYRPAVLLTPTNLIDQTDPLLIWASAAAITPAMTMSSPFHIVKMGEASPGLEKTPLPVLV